MFAEEDSPWREQFPTNHDPDGEEARRERIKSLKQGLFPSIAIQAGLWIVGLMMAYVLIMLFIYSWRYPHLTQRELILNLPDVVLMRDIDEGN